MRKKMDRSAFTMFTRMPVSLSGEKSRPSVDWSRPRTLGIMQGRIAELQAMTGELVDELNRIAASGNDPERLYLVVASKELRERLDADAEFTKKRALFKRLLAAEDPTPFLNWGRKLAAEIRVIFDRVKGETEGGATPPQQQGGGLFSGLWKLFGYNP
jgi:hypothetical protein